MVDNTAALVTGRLCPEGWRISSEQDFLALRDFIVNDGFRGQEAAVLKTTTGWFQGNNGLDVYGFSGLPAGYATSFGDATGAQAIAIWAMTDVSSATATRRVMGMLDRGPLLFADDSVLLGAAAGWKPDSDHLDNG